MFSTVAPCELAAVIAQIASPVRAPAVRIVGASKGQDEAAVEAAIRAGITVFGENKVQEAKGKWPALRARHPQVELHMIGPLQSNKANEAVMLFDCIQSLDRARLADALAEAMRVQGRRIPCYVQVNTGAEPQKSGVPPRKAAEFIRECRAKGLAVEGLMCVPPAQQHPAPHFALLRKLARECGVTRLSMGMSGDFETAVRLGATEVRIGRALFGERD